MKKCRNRSACVEDHQSPSRRLGSAEAAVVIVIILVAGILVLTGQPLVLTLQLLGGAGLLAGATLAVTRDQRLRAFLRAALSTTATAA